MSRMCFRIASRKSRAAAAARVVVPGFAQRLVALERELRVDGDGARRVRERQQAVGTAAVGKRRLQAVGRRRQDLAHQIGELELAEGAARLLVGEDVLKAHHLAGERHDVLLRLVDRGESPFEARHRLQRAIGGGFEAGAQGFGKRELLSVQASLHLALARPEGLL